MAAIRAAGVFLLALGLFLGQLGSIGLHTEILWPFHPILVYARPDLDLSDAEPLLVAYSEAGPEHDTSREVDVVELGWVDQRTQRILAQGVLGRSSGPARKALLESVSTYLAAARDASPQADSDSCDGVRAYLITWDLRSGSIRGRELIGEAPLR